MTDDQRQWISGVRDRLSGVLIDLDAILAADAHDRQARTEFQKNIRQLASQRSDHLRRRLTDRQHSVRADLLRHRDPGDETDAA